MVLDLDGTLVTGDAVLVAYADAIVELAGLTGTRADRVEAALDPIRAGADLPGADDAPDGYRLLAAAARLAGVPDDVVARAYGSARRGLEEGRIPFAVPDGLAHALASRPPGVRAVVVTNSPADGVTRVLERAGLARLVDDVVGDAGKPDGFAETLAALAARAGVPADRVLSVGDLWGNDLAPAAAIGAATAFVDRFGTGAGAPTRRARTLEELLPAITEWWSG